MVADPKPTREQLDFQAILAAYFADERKPPLHQLSFRAGAEWALKWERERVAKADKH